ncbi:MAG: Uma2 family endonuclease [Planctomycetota bacterium]|nr:Uma2 family endonuclease [Planctomycetota bacterium]
MATVAASQEQHLLLTDEPWETYTRLLRTFSERRHLRISYDRGTLEIVTLSPEHELLKHLVSRLIVAATEELGLPIAGCGSLTLRRRKRRRGLEPDEAFWIQNESTVRNLPAYRPQRDIPPDLVVEIDVTHASLDRLPIYAGLGVPEPVEESRALPGVTTARVNELLARRGLVEQNALVLEFREGLRRTITG